MWRFLSSVEPPAKKKADEKPASSKQYEETRVRKFQKAWLTKFNGWLRYDNETELMFCVLCERYGPKDQKFVKGCTSLRMESLKTHASSKVHARSVEADKAAKSRPGTTPVVRLLQQMNAEAIEKLRILFRTAHAVAKHSRPFTDYVWLCNLDEKKGLNIGQTYRTDVKCREFIGAIAEVERMKLENLAKNVKYLAIMCDEATDTAVMEQLIIYIR